MDASIVIDPFDELKKKSKRRKSRESVLTAGENVNVQTEDKSNEIEGHDFLGNTGVFRAGADVVSSLDMNCNSIKEKKEKDRSRKEDKEKDRSRKEKKEKERSKKGEKAKDENKLNVSDHKVEKEKKMNQTSDEGKASNVLEKNKKRKKRSQIGDEGVTSNVVEASDKEVHVEGEEQAREGGRLKKTKNKDKKELKKADDAGEKGSGGHHGSVQNQGPVSDKKKEKKKRVMDQETESLCGSAVHSDSHEDNTGVSSSKKKGKYGRSKTRQASNSIASESSEMIHDDGANLIENQIENEVIERVQSQDNKKKKKKKKKKDKEADSLVRNNENNRISGNKRNKEKSNVCNTEIDAIADSSKTKKRKKVAKTSEKSTSSKKPKKVRFSDQDEVFSLPDDLQGVVDRNTSFDGLIRGKRFSKEEDELVKVAVHNYIETHQLGENGISMVMECRKHPELKNCWKEIGESLPWRPYVSVYSRAHALFERAENRKWTKEELDRLKEYHEKHGSDWKTLSQELGKYRRHLKDQWRRIKLPNLKLGHWSQEEYQSLFDLVNLDLSMKVFQEKKSKHGMLRDNISWEAISEKLETRNTPNCCHKWYDQLTSPLVGEGKWSDVDDYRLLIALVELDAACEEEVDWDNLLEHRSGEICRKRWSQMVHYIGEHGVKPFNVQVDLLSKRYCPELLEPREDYANRPYVD